MIVTRFFVASLAFVAAGGLAGCASSGPRGPVLESKLPGTFAQLSNIAEVRDGRIAFADTRDRLFFIGDFTRGEVDTVGERVDTVAKGDTGAAYKLPGAVADLAADTVALIDFAAERTTLWTGDGTFARVLPVPPVAGTAPVLVYDTLGHGYKVDYRAVLGGLEPGQAPTRPDSLPVLRINLATGVADTVASLGTPEFGEARFGEQKQEVAKVFGPLDVFGVLTDGTIWVARGATNSVDWRGPDGKWIRGRARDYQKITVTQADRDQVMARLRERGLPTQVEVAFPFAEHKPAFENALGRAASGGEVWVQRSRATEEAPIVYDVFGRDSRWRREVTLPEGAALLGFGAAGAIYAGVKDGDRRAVGRFVER